MTALSRWTTRRSIQGRNGPRIPLERLPNFVKTFGPVAGLAAFSRIYFAGRRRAGETFSLDVAGQRFWMRHSASDASIFVQIFVKQEYSTIQWRQHERLIEHYQALLAEGRTPIIVDAGANIGLSALWFAKLYPNAKIYAVEPDDANMELLARNIADKPQIVPLRGAVWDRPARLRIADPAVGAGAFRVVEGEGRLRAYAVPEILAMEERGALFIVKIDIEGGETSLFRSNTAWVGEAAMIAIELHDWLYPNERISQNFLRCISAFPVDFLFQGENVFCFRSA
jgi:FkbM family methyltransferase